MKRRLFTLAAATSFLLSIAVVVLWARSFHYADRLVQSGPYDAWSNHRYVSLFSQRGALRVEVGTRQRSPFDDESGLVPGTHLRAFKKGANPSSYPGGWPTYDDVQRYGHAWFGFAYVDSQEGYPNWSPGFRNKAIVVPDWFIVALAALSPAPWLVVRYRERRRQRQGACRICGYDLRASPHQCPECGTVVSHGGAAAG